MRHQTEIREEKGVITRKPEEVFYPESEF